MEIKEFNSKDFNYSEETLNKFLPLFQAYVNIALDENETVSLQDLYKTLPEVDNAEYAKISCIKNIHELIVDNARCFVLYKDEKPVSFTLFSKDDYLAKYHLELVYTAKNFQNKGYAKQLMKECFNRLSEDAFCVSATVNDTNYASKGLNSSLGYPFTLQDQSFSTDNDGKLNYYYHIINTQMLDYIKNMSNKNNSLLFLANNIGDEEFKMLKEMMQKNAELEKE